jgi:hypothetical protein
MNRRNVIGRTLLAATLLMGAAVSLGPVATAQEAAPTATHTPTMLYAVSGTNFALTSKDGRTGTLTVTRPGKVLQFTDRPDHWSDRIPAGAMLTNLGLTGRPLDVRGEAPNAVLALTGQRTLPLEITHGSVAKDGTLTLRVARLGPALPSAAGTGSLFVDSAAPLRVSLVGSDGVEWGALEVYWEGSHWTVVPYYDGTRMASERYYRKDFFASWDPTMPWGKTFFSDDDRFTIGMELVDGDLTQLRFTNYFRGDFVINANAPDGPACEPACVLATRWSGPLYAT